MSISPHLIGGHGMIADPIHKYILYTRPLPSTSETTELDLIDTPWFQRLRRIPQLQAARWVFPGAEHSRFQHSLGAMHLAGRFGQQLYPSLKRTFPEAPSQSYIEELLRVAGLLHDIGHGPFGHFFDDHYLIDYGLTHELVGQRIIREVLADMLRQLRRSPSGPFSDGERINPDWVCYLMGKSFSVRQEQYPEWLSSLKPVLSGVFTADNMDYVLRDAYMCGVGTGPIDVDRLIYYSFVSDKGLTLDKKGIEALLMFLRARFYMYSNVYYHRTTRGIDMHLREIFGDSVRLVFPYDLRSDLAPYVHFTEWRLLDEVERWRYSENADRRRLAAEWRGILDRKLKWRMAAEEVLDQFDNHRGVTFLDARTIEHRVRNLLPPHLRTFNFRVDMAFQDPRPLNPLMMGDRQIYIFDPASKRISEEPLDGILRSLPGKVAQCRIFTIDHDHDSELGQALNYAISGGGLT